MKAIICDTGPLLAVLNDCEKHHAASVIAIAERLGVSQLACIDHRHMRAVALHHCDGFELLPT